MINFGFETIKELVPIIDSKRDYWFVRTYSGEVYEDYVKNNYVGIGLNNVPYEYIKAANLTIEKDAPPFIRLRDYIDKNTEYKSGEATKWANQLVNFEHNLKINDVVIIPNRGGIRYSVGIVESETFISENTGTFQFNDKPEQYPQKRKKINWIKTINRVDFRGELNGLFSSHQGITNATRFSDVIESYLSNVFIKEDKMYLKIYFNQDEDINAFELSRFLQSLTEIYKEFNIENGSDPESELNIKIKLQSKGSVLLKASGAIAGFGIIGLLILSNNMEFKTILPNGTKLSAKSDGLLKSIMDYKERSQTLKHNDQLFQDSLKALHASSDSTIDVPEVEFIEVQKQVTKVTRAKEIPERAEAVSDKKGLGDGKK